MRRRIERRKVVLVLMLTVVVAAVCVCVCVWVGGGKILAHPSAL